MTTTPPLIAFDLDGTGRRQTWEWITPRAGWLVWDPRGRGQVTSATQLFGSRLGDSHGDGQDGVGAETRLVVGAVEVDHGLVDEGLFLSIEADDRFGNLGIDVLDRLHHAVAAPLMYPGGPGPLR